MKGFKVTLATVASALLLAAPAMAFHDGGVARCEGCHTMHNSLDGATMPTTAAYGGTQFQSGLYLLQGNGTQSDACLVCHQVDTDTAPSGYHVSTITTNLDAAANKWPLQAGPGGDFGWINLNTGSNYKRGHNINATSHNYGTEPRFGTTSPGGSYLKADFNCSSCHDPHARYRYLAGTTTEVMTGAPIAESGTYNADADPNYAIGTFRFLGGAGYKPKSTTSPAFTATAPVAIAPSSYNRLEVSAGAKSDTIVAYGTGMSEWCGNCHASLVEAAYVSGEKNHKHPASSTAATAKLSNDNIYLNYNNYVASGNLTGIGTQTTGGYTSLVPFETGADRATLYNYANGVTTIAAAGSSNVMCLSCHRAHASGFNSMLRYDPTSFMTTVDTTGATVYSTASDGNAMLTAAYYGRPASSFVGYQRALCNKCHAKD